MQHGLDGARRSVGCDLQFLLGAHALRYIPGRRAALRPSISDASGLE